jgi:hypothetical protein
VVVGTAATLGKSGETQCQAGGQVAVHSE